MIIAPRKSDRFARPVAGMLMKSRKRVEDGAFANIRIAGQGDDDHE
jgi:hypothetical protein